MGIADRARGGRVAHPDDHHLAELMHIRSRIVLAATLVAAALLPVHASSPKFFQAGTQAGFPTGAAEKLSIDSHGQLTLGPMTELIYETSAPFLWAMVAAADG